MVYVILGALVLALVLAVAPVWPYSRTWGYSPVSGLAVVLLMLTLVWMYNSVDMEIVRSVTANNAIRP